jgi:DNA topoisomerase-1
MQRKRKSNLSKIKPLEKPDKFCMDIEDDSNSIVENKDIIKKFVHKLYKSKRFGDDKMDPEEINIILDTKGRRVCISPVRKNNSIYIKFQNIHKKISDDMLEVNDYIRLGKPTADILVHHLDSDKTEVPAGLKWVTLSHNGPYFTWIMEPYEPHGVPIKYDNKSYKLNPTEEEIANFYARRIITDETATIAFTSNQTFNKNFWKDFKTYLTPEHKKIFTDFSKFNFSKIVNKLKEIKDSVSDSEKREKKIKTEERKAEYGYAIVNGVREKIGAFVVEQASIFLGRGQNKITGSIKRNITPEEVTINVGKKDKTPIPPPGYKWKEVVHDQKAEWIAKWTDPLSKKIKHVYLSSEGQFKSNSDAQKFEKSRKLNKYIESIRKGYTKFVNSSDIKERQLGTVVYLVDNYGIRIGGDNDDSTADTFGASTLLVEHIKLKNQDTVKFEFLGKDSILYKQTMTLPDRIFKNLEYFVKDKKKNLKIFDKISACDINNYLKNFDKDISAKVFRTRLGSSIMYTALEKTKIKKKSTELEKRKAFENANIEVANVLNHQRSIPKSSEKGIQKLQEEIEELEKQLKAKKGKDNKTISSKLEKKKSLLNSKNNLKNIAISTSRTNYIDPRLVVAWCKKNELDIKKIYTPILLRKFKWAIDTTDEEWDYLESDMLPGFETLTPKIEDSCTYKKKTPPSSPKPEKITPSPKPPKITASPKPPKITALPIKKASSPKITSKAKPSSPKATLVESYKMSIKEYGYSLVNKNGYKLHREDSKIPNIMKKLKTYQDIYILCIDLNANNMKYLALLLLMAICRDSKKHPDINEIIKKSGYVNKYKYLVMSM